MSLRSGTGRLLLLGTSLCLLAVLGWQHSVISVLAEVAVHDQNWPIILLSLVGLYVVRPFLLWPLSVLSIFIGFAFGIVLGVPLVLAGTVLTCTIPFYVAAKLDSPPGYLRRIADRSSTAVQSTGELRGVVAARLSPAPADVVSYGAGLAGVSPSTFAVGTVVGELPWAVFYVVLGHSLQSFSRSELQQTDLRLLLLATTVALVLVSSPLYRTIRSTDR